MSFAELLFEKILDGDYFSGMLSFSDDTVDYSLSLSLIIYRDSRNNQTHTYAKIEKIVDVWWEMKSVTEQGEELNDFDFEILKKIMLRC